jgi:hypothetical protein
MPFLEQIIVTACHRRSAAKDPQVQASTHRLGSFAVFAAQDDSCSFALYIFPAITTF